MLPSWRIHWFTDTPQTDFDGNCAWHAGVVFFVSGCNLFPRHNRWQPPVLAEPLAVQSEASVALDPAESLYADALRLESIDTDGCVDRYYQCATHTWFGMEHDLQRSGAVNSRRWHLYHSAVTGLVRTAQKFGRLTPDGLVTATANGVLSVPSNYYDFPWSSDDFRILFAVGEYPTRPLSRRYRYAGLGVPVVASATARAKPFMLANQVFAATVVLRTVAPQQAHDLTREFRLEFRNPLYGSAIGIGETQVALARDITAPLAFVIDRDDRGGLTSFLQPGASVNADGLHMIEPYQPGKIPVIFLHGLLSDATTWADLGNELRARKDILDRYQLWAFRYPTGRPFLVSAATLRKQLREIQTVLDPNGTDPALRHMVLIGHSMGGLVAKLQVTHSGDSLWSAIANRPLSTIRTTPAIRQRLTDAFYFDPSPAVTRVIFIGTPHAGSSWAQRLVGRLGSIYAKQPDQSNAKHDRIVQDNPGVFSREVRCRIPTSIDLLRPNSPLLQATGTLPYRPGVSLHSIIGNGFWMLGDGPSDTVVPVSSARLCNVNSEKILRARHTELHHKTETIQEVLRILDKHHREFRWATLGEHKTEKWRAQRDSLPEQSRSIAR